MSEPEPTSVSIRAHSRRQAMDWSLVLASQDIETFIEKQDAGSWNLIVGAGDYERAVGSIRQYRVENRAWNWRRELPGTGLVFHTGAVFFCVVLALVYRWSRVELPFLEPAWIFSSEKFAQGQWGRAITGMLLHGDLTHLLSNMTSGGLLLGLVMARFGPAFGLLGALIAGAVGFLSGLAFYHPPYQALGASGLIMGALGMLSIHTVAEIRLDRRFQRESLRGLLSGILLFVLLGFAPKTDVIAHTGGFLSGLILGLPMLHLQQSGKKWTQTLAWLLFWGLLIGAAGMGLVRR